MVGRDEGKDPRKDGKRK